MADPGRRRWPTVALVVFVCLAGAAVGGFLGELAAILHHLSPLLEGTLPRVPRVALLFGRWSGALWGLWAGAAWCMLMVQRPKTGRRRWTIARGGGYGALVGMSCAMLVHVGLLLLHWPDEELGLASAFPVLVKWAGAMLLTGLAFGFAAGLPTGLVCGGLLRLAHGLAQPQRKEAPDSP